MGKHVFITGSAGYLGSMLCDHLLSAGYRVTGLDNLRYGQHSHFHLCANPNFEFIHGDARDERLVTEAMKSADVIIPLAAVVGVGACAQDPWLAQALNFDAVEMIRKRRSKQQLIVYPNTNSGYGTKSGEVMCTEDSPLEPISLYGRTKVQAEQALLADDNTITLRLATVFGMSPRMRLDLLVNHFTYAAVTDGYLILFEKHFKRNYIHVRDVADTFIHCIEHAEHMVGKPYNAGNDEANLSKEQLALTIKEQVPKLVIHADEIAEDPDKRNYIVSNERLRQAGFEAKRGLTAGITELLKGYRMLGRHPFKNV